MNITPSNTKWNQKVRKSTYRLLIITFGQTWKLVSPCHFHAFRWCVILPYPLGSVLSPIIFSFTPVHSVSPLISYRICVLGLFLKETFGQQYGSPKGSLTAILLLLASLDIYLFVCFFGRNLIFGSKGRT